MQRRIATQRQRQVVDLFAIIGQILSDFEGAIPAAKLDDKLTDQLNARIIDVLSKINGRSLGNDLEGWRKWWAEEQGYAYESPAPRTRPDLTLADDKPTFVDRVHLLMLRGGHAGPHVDRPAADRVGANWRPGLDPEPSHGGTQLSARSRRRAKQTR